MLHTTRASRGMVVAPHHLATESGLAILREGGNAIEAAVAAASTVAVVYPHMNTLGGDNFWLLTEPGADPVAIEACGPAAALASVTYYRAKGLRQLPSRGAQTALTVAGAVAGWKQALTISGSWGGHLPVTRLLADAEHYAREGFPVSAGQSEATATHLKDLAAVSGFTYQFAPGGEPPKPGAVFRQAALADTLGQLGRAGLADFYRGEIARSMAADLAGSGSPLRLRDLAEYRVRQVRPLRLRTFNATAFNLPPPTQGLSSLMILGIFERLAISRAESFEHVHGLVEATKQAFEVRDRHITDPDAMAVDPRDFLEDSVLGKLATQISPSRARDAYARVGLGDTVWLGCIDGDGRAVSLIQSIYWPFGSGVVLPGTGVLWQNRGVAFSLAEGTLRCLAPGRRPFHTLNPALAQLDDGRLMVYGCMGGEGQPQTQAAVFTRHAVFGQPLQPAIDAPRWVWGKTWGEPITALRMENRFDPDLIEKLRRAGHRVELTQAFDSAMGHAGALVLQPDGVIEGASDPRSDGAAAGF